MRRITSSYYDYYYQRYKLLLFQQVNYYVGQAGARDDLLDVVRRELLWALIHWDRSKHKGLLAYVIQRIKRRLQHYVRDETRHMKRFVTDDDVLTLADKPVSSPLLRPIVDEVLAVVNPFERQAIVGTLRDGKSLRALAQETGTTYHFLWRARNSGLAKIRDRFPDASAVLP